MEIRYHPGTDDDYVVYLQQLPWKHEDGSQQKELIVYEGHYRWKINMNGEEYILRPESQKEHDTNPL